MVLFELLFFFDSNNKKRNQNLIEDLEAWKFLASLEDNEKDFSISLSKLPLEQPRS